MGSGKPMLRALLSSTYLIVELILSIAKASHQSQRFAYIQRSLTKHRPVVGIYLTKERALGGTGDIPYSRKLPFRFLVKPVQTSDVAEGARRGGC